MSTQGQTAEATRSEEKSRTFYTSVGSRTVVTYVQDGSYSSRLWVNCKAEIKNPAVDLGDATLVARNHSSEAGARKWAAKAVAR